MSQRGRQGGRTTPHFFADQLTLSRPGGAHYPHPVLLAPPDFQTLRHACAGYKHLAEIVFKNQDAYSHKYCVWGP